eukprot:9501824-Pyramimonas_sp.AAC.1
MEASRNPSLGLRLVIYNGKAKQILMASDDTWLLFGTELICMTHVHDPRPRAEATLKKRENADALLLYLCGKFPVRNNFCFI